MAEAHQARMQNEVEEMVQSLERDHIRKMQVCVSNLWKGEPCMSLIPHMSHLCVYVCVCVLAAGSHVQVQCRLL